MRRPEFCCGDCRHWDLRPDRPARADCRPPGRRDFRRSCVAWVWRYDNATTMPALERLRLWWRRATRRGPLAA